MFKEKKAAQIAAFFIRKNAKPISHLKLIKLLYLSDRKSFERYGYSISDDYFVSMPHGPVLSKTLDLIHGYTKSGYWKNTISNITNNTVSLLNPRRKDTSELSRADKEILEYVWNNFGHMDKWEIRDYTHDNCGEWEDPLGSSHEIPLERLLTNVGWSAEDIRNIVEMHRDNKSIDQAFCR
uniref:Uncharacterized phage-associated protein n=1 Tax=Candidatus Kentrum sp. MB TaxID=2138164 RepID=A0A450XCY3_9GAMM|nr:MAG: Uncharacterized phage-associated protein [Candidatus Kentron sp. MB]VFK31427.1 MAG: Uncharacterized phage-associated protein [Candidatus Kentron sp. MB]VFK75477.1 MAG: Uncharacterized phage-associated protein [Candidatus Kentron sp. MB]